jgi:hypothetical protein
MTACLPIAALFAFRTIQAVENKKVTSLVAGVPALYVRGASTVIIFALLVVLLLLIVVTMVSSMSPGGRRDW